MLNMEAGQRLLGRVRSDLISSNLLGTLPSTRSKAHTVVSFQALPISDHCAWRAIISAEVKRGEKKQAFDQFCQMQIAGILPDSHVFVAVLQCCPCSRLGRLIEFLAVESGLYAHLVVGNSLIHMYVQFGHLDAARYVFDRFGSRSVVTWSSMISGYAKYGFYDEALQLFQDMQYQCLTVNQVAFICVMKACSSLQTGKAIHVHIVANGMDSDIIVQNSLIEMYVRCGSMKNAWFVFYRASSTDVVTWSSMIGGCIKHGQFEQGLKLFEQMQHQNIQANEVTFVHLLKACFTQAALDVGKMVHYLVIECNFPFHGTISNSLIDMYGKLGDFKDAHKIFDQSPKDVVSWGALIVACSLHGRDKEALQFFHEMLKTGTDPDQIIFSCTLKACSNISALWKGQIIHIHLIKSGNGFELSNSNTLIDLYIKCGSLDDACRVFDRSSQQSVVTWNTIILGCCECGKFNLAKQYFVDMQQKGLKPNSMTFSCLLLTCSHMGLVSEGLGFYTLMCNDYDISPDIGHFVSLVHLLGHTGYLDEAKCLLGTLPFGPGVVGWRSLLSQCGEHGDVNLGQQCFEYVAVGDQREAAGYVLMSTMQMHSGIKGTETEVEQLRKYVNAWKKPAHAFIEIDGEVHSFTVGDECYQDIEGIYRKLKQLCVKMVEEGYMHKSMMV